jgi:hypothetical protein
MTKRFKVLGVNDDKSTCECCGKKGLLQVVWIEDTETGEIKHFGTSCANHPVKGFDLKKEISSAVQDYKNSEQNIHMQAWRQYRADFGKEGVENYTYEYKSKGKTLTSIGARPRDKAAYEAIVADIRGKVRA